MVLWDDEDGGGTLRLLIDYIWWDGERGPTGPQRRVSCHYSEHHEHLGLFPASSSYDRQLVLRQRQSATLDGFPFRLYGVATQVGGQQPGYAG